LQEHLLAHPRDAQVLLRAGEMLQGMGRYDEAAAHLQRALTCGGCPLGTQAGDSPPAAGPNDLAVLHYEILQRMGDCCIVRTDLAAAHRYYAAAAALAPQRAGPRVGLGTLAFREGDLAEAERHFSAATRLDSSCGEAHAGLAVVRQEQGDYRAAFHAYLRCLELDADNMVALLGLFQTSCQMGSFAQIISYLETYLGRHPDDAAVLFCLAALYARERRYGEARAAVRKVLSLEPDKCEAATLLAELDQAQDPLGPARERNP